MEFIGNVLTGVLPVNDIDDYNFDILDRNIEQGGTNNQSETTARHWYTFRSKNNIMVSASAFKCRGYAACNLFPR